MGLPTLRLKGKLVPPTEDNSVKAELDEWIPYEYILNWFAQRMNKTGIENRVLILKSETASGKSTMFPPELYKAFVHGKNAPGIICTQPRVLTAIANVNEMLKWYSTTLRLGSTIGWSTQHNKLKPTEFGLLSATIGTLAAMLSGPDEDIMTKYKFILIDETHERDLPTDLTIYMLKNMLKRQADNPMCPFVVLMSATFDPAPLLKYFDIKPETNFIWCRGETAGFDEMWDWNEGRTVNNYMQAAAIVVERICRENQNDDPSKADILIFLPGAAEFTQALQYLNKLNAKFASEGLSLFSILRIDGGAVKMQTLDYQRLESIPIEEHIVKIDGKEYIPRRRVILSTVVAETGLTLDNLRYVIDCGYNREIEYNPVYGISALITKPAPQPRIIQRRGRAGRKFRGMFWPLYPKYIYNLLQPVQFPKILTEDVGIIIIDIIREQLRSKRLMHLPIEFDMNDVDMIDAPTPDALSAAVEKMYSLGFISPVAPPWTEEKEEMLSAPLLDLLSPGGPVIRYGLTRMGVLASYFSMMPPESVRMILSAYFWGVNIDDIVSIAAYLEVGSQSFASAAIADDESEIVKSAPPPPIKWDEIYTSSFKNLARDLPYEKFRLLCADSFMDGCLLYGAIYQALPGAHYKVYLEKLAAAANISHAGIINFIKARDRILNQMIAAGFKINTAYRCLHQVPTHEFIDAITKIKHCVYDGFRNNIITLQKGDGGIYKTLNGLEVKKPAFFADIPADKKPDIEPQKIIYRNIAMKWNMKTEIYELIVDSGPLCVLDGFVSTDDSFVI